MYTKFTILFLLLTSLVNAQQQLAKINSAKPASNSVIELTTQNNQKFYIDFYGENIFRVFYSPDGKKFHDPEAKPAAKILVENPRRSLAPLKISDNANQITIATKQILQCFARKNVYV